MTMVAGIEASGTGASTVRMPSTESDDTIVVASISAGSLKLNEGVNRVTKYEVLPFQILKVPDQ